MESRSGTFTQVGLCFPVLCLVILSLSTIIYIESRFFEGDVFLSFTFMEMIRYLLSLQHAVYVKMCNISKVV